MNVGIPFQAAFPKVLSKFHLPLAFRGPNKIFNGQNVKLKMPDPVLKKHAEQERKLFVTLR
jgi:hypothetical protein